MFIFGFDVCVCAKVHSDSFAHDGFAVEDLSDADGRVFIVEGDDDSSKGLQRRPRVDWRGGIDQFLDGLEIVGAKDGFVL